MRASSNRDTKRRKVAIAVRTWNSDESVFMWRWVKKHFLRTDHRDKLYIVHVETGRDKSLNWRAGGPLLPEIDRALQDYSYDIVVEQSESAGAGLLQWTEAEGDVDVLVIGIRSSKSRIANALTSSTTDHVTQNAKCACLVIHPKTSFADLHRMHAAQCPEPLSLLPSAPRNSASCRRVVIAYPTGAAAGAAIGEMLNVWAAENCLSPDDFILQLQIDRKSIMTRLGGLWGRKDRDKLEERSADSGRLGPAAAADEGASYSTDGPPMRMISQFIVDNNIDMLIVPTSKHSAIRRVRLKRRQGMSMSIYHKVQCACLMVPLSRLPILTASGLSASVGEEQMQEIAGLMFLSEDDGGEESVDNVADLRRGRASKGHVSPEPARTAIDDLSPRYRSSSAKAIKSESRSVSSGGSSSMPLDLPYTAAPRESGGRGGAAAILAGFKGFRPIGRKASTPAPDLPRPHSPAISSPALPPAGAAGVGTDASQALAALNDELQLLLIQQPEAQERAASAISAAQAALALQRSEIASLQARVAAAVGALTGVPPAAFDGPPPGSAPTTTQVSNASLPAPFSMSSTGASSVLTSSALGAGGAVTPPASPSPAPVDGQLSAVSSAQLSNSVTLSPGSAGLAVPVPPSPFSNSSARTAIPRAPSGEPSAVQSDTSNGVQDADNAVIAAMP